MSVICFKDKLLRRMFLSPNKIAITETNVQLQTCRHVPFRVYESHHRRMLYSISFHWKQFLTYHCMQGDGMSLQQVNDNIYFDGIVLNTGVNLLLPQEITK